MNCLNNLLRHRGPLGLKIGSGEAPVSRLPAWPARECSEMAFIGAEQCRSVRFVMEQPPGNVFPCLLERILALRPNVPLKIGREAHSGIRHGG